MKTHPLNQSYEWPRREGPFRLISQQQADQWNDVGFFLLQNVFDPALIAQVAAAIDPFESEMEQFVKSRGGQYFINRAGELTFTIHLVKKSTVARDFTCSPVFADLCIDLLGPDARLYWDQAVYKKPGTKKEFPWHQDNGYTFIEPQTYLTCWVPLTPATIDNGCPWVIPGVHRMGTLEHWTTDLGYQCATDRDDAVPIEGKPGDVVVFSSLTPHRTGPNLSTDIRKAYIVQFAPDGVVMRSRDGDHTRTRQNDPERQYLVASEGKPVIAQSQPEV